MTAYLPSSPGKHIILSLCMILLMSTEWCLCNCSEIPNGSFVLWFANVGKTYLFQQICNTNLKVTVNRNCNFIIKGVLGGIFGTFK